LSNNKSAIDPSGKNNPKVTKAWAFYDWANSVFSLTITTAVFPIYFEEVTGGEGGIVSFLSMRFENTALFSYSLSGAFLLVALINPLLSGIADVGGFKKRFMQFFTFLGALSCIGLYWFTKDTLSIGIVFFMMATVGYAGSLVFYNSYLPEIATPDKFDRLSARGYAMGYIGCVILLVFNLIMIKYPTFFGLENSSIAARVSFATVGIWWAGFALYPFWLLPKDKRMKIKANMLLKGYHEVNKVYKQLKESKVTKRFLFSFFFYSMGVQTVMYLAALFGKVELSMTADKLIVTILIIQIVAIGGAYMFARISELKGTLFSLIILVIIWIGICIGAYYTKTDNGFYILAFLVGSVMGGIQSQSRSAYAGMIRGETDTASFFSFYELTEKVAVFMGTLSFGFIIELNNGSMRYSVLALITFFIFGLVLLLWTMITDRKIKKGINALK
jgi:MFS transporter, UMF1 family